MSTSPVASSCEVCAAPVHQMLTFFLILSSDLNAGSKPFFAGSA